MTFELVAERNRSRTMTHLGMRCDGREMPFPLNGGADVTHWIGVAVFEMSRADPRAPDAERRWYGDTKREPFALALDRDRFYAIWAPQSPDAAAAWIAASLDDVTVEAVGSAGIMRKRPRGIRVEHAEWMLGIMHVGQLLPGSNLLKGNQEGALHQALTRSS